MYVLNGATGEVHERSCTRLGRMQAANLVPWEPARAHLAPGVRPCPECLTEVPAVGRPVELLEDPDGAPYQSAVQRLVAMLSFGSDEMTQEFRDRLVDALEETAWYAWRDGRDSDPLDINSHQKPEAEG